MSLDVASLELDTIFIGSSNEGYLAAFKEIPEFQSFKGRMELVRVPYLLDYRVEQKIYEAQIKVAHAESGKHVAPHVAWVAALWAVLTRMKKPLAGEVRQGAGRSGRASWGRSRRRCSTPTRITPEGLSTEQQRELVVGRREDRARVGHLPELRGPHRRVGRAR